MIFLANVFLFALMVYAGILVVRVLFNGKRVVDNLYIYIVFSLLLASYPGLSMSGICHQV